MTRFVLRIQNSSGQSQFVPICLVSRVFEEEKDSVYNIGRRGPLQGAVIEALAGRPCGLLGSVSWLLLGEKSFLRLEIAAGRARIRGLFETTDGLHGRSQMETEPAV